MIRAARCGAYVAVMILAVVAMLAGTLIVLVAELLNTTADELLGEQGS